MGNLSQKYTDEEWEDLGKLVKENPPLCDGWELLFGITYDKFNELIKTTPNDQELGSKIRSLINS